MKNILEGMEAIKTYVGWSESRIKKMHETRKFPLVKLDGRWMSTIPDIDEWHRKQLSSFKTT